MIVVALPVMEQNALFTHDPSVLPEELTYTPDGPDTVTLTAVYVPAGTFTLVITRLVSDCSRVSSKFPELNTDTALPLEGVNDIPTMGRVKLATEVLVGGVSVMVRLNNASPPPPQFVVHLSCNPLQELSARIATTAIKIRVFLEFIDIPHDRIWLTAPDGPGRLGIPQNTVAHVAGAPNARKGRKCSSANRTPGQGSRLA